MNNIFLSIIIPVFNTEKYLVECLDSALQRCHMPYEIVCVNDGSTDRSLSILEDYQKRFPQMRIVSQENAGLSVARNTGIAQAQGEYVLFLDSDDVLIEGALGEIGIALKRDMPEILLYDADCIYETEKLKETQYKNFYYHRSHSYGVLKVGQEMFCEMIEGNDFCDSACMMVIRRNWILEKQILFRAGMVYEDCLFSFLCYMESQKVSHINKSFLKYRIREHSIMQSPPSFYHVNCRLEIYTVVLKYLLEHECEQRLQNAIEKFAQFIETNIQLTFEELSATEKEKRLLLHGAKAILLRNICNTSVLASSEVEVLIKGFQESVCSAEGIYIYGAGKVGTTMYTYLKSIGVEEKVKAFIVSGDKPTSMKDGVEILSISEVTDKTALVLLCARMDFQEEMYTVARKYGFKNIVPTNAHLEKYIHMHC